MRIASVAPDKARAEIQKIKENDYGFFEAETGGAVVSTKSGYTNPLGELTGSMHLRQAVLQVVQ